MANPYTTWVKGVRRTAQQAWTVARSNLANIGLDYVTSALETIMDLDTADGKLLSTVRAPGISVGGVVDWPSAVYTGTDQNAKFSPIFVDLDNSDDVWDFEKFMHFAQMTSWHEELGDPPVHGVMFITESQDKLVWWNRETGAAYMTFTAGASNMFVGTLSCLAFLDGVIYCGSSGNHFRWCDLLRDSGYAWTTSGTRRYKSDVEDRNASSGVYTPITTPSLRNGTIRCVAVTRDSLGRVDEFNRPLQWWAEGDDGGASIYHPVDDTIYDSSATTDMDFVAKDLAHGLAMVNDNGGTKGQIDFRRSIETITADGYSSNEDRWSNAQSAADDLDWTAAADFTGVQILPEASLCEDGSPLVVFSSDEGIYLRHTHNHGNTFENRAKGALVRLTETYASPYMKGYGSFYPMVDATDCGGQGHDFTNNNSVTFTAGGPTGSYATFDGVNQSLSLADPGGGYFDGMNSYCISYWLYIIALPSGTDEYIMSKYDETAGGGTWRHGIDSSGVLTCMMRISAGNRTLTGPTLAISTWYHIAHNFDLVNGTELWVNAEKIANNTATGSATGNTYDIILGGLGDGSGGGTQDFSNIRLGGVGFNAGGAEGNVGWSRREIEAEYTRGLRTAACIAASVDANGTISDNDVESVSTDVEGNYIAAGYGDKNVDILDALGVPILRDVYPGTTLRGTAVRSMPGGKDLHYVMAGDDQLEFVQPDTEIPV